MQTAVPTQIVVTAAAPVAVVPPPHTISGFTTIFGIAVNPMVIAFVVIAAMVAWFIYQGQRQNGQNTFDVWDLLMDTLDKGHRRASGIKCAFQAAFMVSTWVVVDQEIKGSLTDLIFGAYLSVWCGSLIAKVVFDKKDAPALPGTHKEGSKE